MSWMSKLKDRISGERRGKALGEDDAPNTDDVASGDGVGRRSSDEADVELGSDRRATD